MTNYYIGDLHFGHKFIIDVDERPFKNADEMDETLVKNWNDTVNEEDTVYVLGDTGHISSRGKYVFAGDVLEQLGKCNGKKILLRGNHDNWMQDIEETVNRILYHESLTVKDKLFGKEVSVFLSHYPTAVWNGQFNGGYHLYAHTHINKHGILFHPEMRRAYNVGCMMKWMDYTPRTLDEIVYRHDALHDMQKWNEIR